MRDENNLIFRKAMPRDAEQVKNLVNEMYGIEYEKRKSEEIAQRIEENDEIYTLAISGNEIIGFAGATTNHAEYKEKYNYGTVIDYVYVKDSFRGLFVAYELIKNLLNELILLGFNTAIMQVQTYNKQRYLHYALSNKNIISTTIEQFKDKTYEDQILLISNLVETANLPMKQLIHKTVMYQKEDEEKDLT